MIKTPEQIELAETQIKEIQVDYNYRIGDFSIGELLKKICKKKERNLISKTIQYLGYLYLHIKETLFGKKLCNQDLLNLFLWEFLYNLYLHLS